MNRFPCLIRTSIPGGEARVGDPLVDSYLAFVAGRSRPNTLRAVAHDLKTFFVVIDKDPVEVAAADIFDFVADQRGDRAVVRISDGESGLSARTIARRLSSISGFTRTWSLVATRRWRPTRSLWAVHPSSWWPASAGAAGAGADAPEDPVARRGDRAAGGVAHPGPGDGLRDGAGRAASLRGSRPRPRGCAGAGAVVVHRRGQGRSPASDPDLEHVLLRGRRLPPPRTATRLRDGSGVRHAEGPQPGTADDRRWGPRSCKPPGPGRSGPGDVPSAAPHVPDPAAGGRDGARSRAGPGRESDRVDPHLPPPLRRLARFGDRRAVERIDADAAAELVAVQAINR